MKGRCKMKLKKIIMALTTALCILTMCVACTSDNAGDNGTSSDNGSMNNTDSKNNATNTKPDDSTVTDDMDELGDDIKDTTEDIKDSVTGDNRTNSSASNTQTNN